MDELPRDERVETVSSALHGLAPGGLNRSPPLESPPCGFAPIYRRFEWPQVPDQLAVLFYC